MSAVLLKFQLVHIYFSKLHPTLSLCLREAMGAARLWQTGEHVLSLQTQLLTPACCRREAMWAHS